TSPKWNTVSVLSGRSGRRSSLRSSRLIITCSSRTLGALGARLPLAPALIGARKPPQGSRLSLGQGHKCAIRETIHELANVRVDVPCHRGEVLIRQTLQPCGYVGMHAGFES